MYFCLFLSKIKSPWDAWLICCMLQWLPLSGHSCAFYPDKKLRVLYGVPHHEKDIYVFDQIHFHFGNDLEHGSEHSMDGKFFPIEVSTNQLNPWCGTECGIGIVSYEIFTIWKKEAYKM